MKIKNIKIVVEQEDASQYIKILDESTNQVLHKGDKFDLSMSPQCIFNGLHFIALQDNSIWISYESLQNYINQPEPAQIVNDEIKIVE